MDTVWTKNASCQELRKNTRHTAGTKRKKCHKCYAYRSTHYDLSKRHTIEKVNEK